MSRKIGSLASRQKKPSEEPPGLKGPDAKFTAKLLTLCLLKGFSNDRSFKLRANIIGVYPFNEIVFETTEGAILMAVDYHNSHRSRWVSFRDLFHRPFINSVHHFACGFSNIDQSLFKIKNVRFITNKPVTKSEIMEKYLPLNNIDEHDVLYCTQKCECYTVGENSKELLRNWNSDISEDTLSDFLGKFQLLSIPEKAIDDEIRKSLRSMEIVGSNVEIVYEYIIEKVRQWYAFVFWSSPLDNFHAAFFLSIWRSSKYGETLNEYNISFKKNSYADYGNRLLYSVEHDCHMLTLKRLHQNIIERNEKMNVSIIINTKDSLPVQRIMIEAFVVPDCRFLIVPLFTNSFDDLRIDDLLQQISHDNNKIIILISNEKKCQKNVTNFEVINSRISLNDLEDTCKNVFLQTSIDFQGRHITLKDVIGSNMDANEIVDEAVLLKLSLREKIQIGNKYEEENFGSLYIDRSFVRDEQIYSESDICNFITTKSSGSFILISDGAGMGKTTVLTKLIELLKDSHPNLWIIRLKLNRLSNVFRKFKQSKAESVELENIIESTGFVFRNNFEKNIFNSASRVVLVIDGVDVVKTIYKNLVLGFLRKCSIRKNILKVIIATRPHLESFFERELNVKSFTLKMFSKEDQIEFLTKYWKINLNLSKRDVLSARFFARHLMERLNLTLGHNSLDLVGVPLQTKIIAEVFQESSGEWGGCKEFLTTENINIELKAHINLAELYKMLIERKGDIFIDEKAGHILVEGMMNKLFQESMTVHKKIALESLVDTEKCKLFAVCRNSNVSDSEQYLLEIGIVQRIEDMWIFVHQTFCEYFVSVCLLEEMQTGNTEWQFLHFLFNDILIPKECAVIRLFFDNMLSIGDISQEIFEVCSHMVSQISWNENKNVVHLAEEGRLNILKLILEKCTTHKYLLQIEDISGLTALHVATKHYAVLEYLVLKGADIKRVNSSGQSVLHKAVFDEDYDVVKFLISKDAEIDCKLKNGKTPLHCAAEKNYCDIVELLIGAYADLDATEQSLKTPLHVAAKNGSLEVVQLLVEAGADIGARTGNGHTALDLAQLCGRSKIVAFLKGDIQRKQEPAR